MDAVVIAGKLDLSVQERPVPEPGEGQVRVRVGYVGICGSDLHYYFEGANGAFVVAEPLVPGHELSGWIDVDPSGRVAPGTPVTVHPARFGDRMAELPDAPHLWPGGSYLGSASTTPHTQGAMSDLLVVDAGMIRTLPEGLPVRRAVLAEPLAVALHGAGRAGALEGARVLVCGAGPIGLLALVAAQARGAASVTVTDLLPEPLGRARELGADEVLRIGEDDVPTEGFDVVLECSGAGPAVTAAVAAVRRRGTVVQIGMLPNEPRPINLAPLVAKEATLVGAFRFLDEMDEALALLLARPDVERVITHEFAPADSVAAFETARRSSDSGKVVVTLSAAREAGHGGAGADARPTPRVVVMGPSGSGKTAVGAALAVDLGVRFVDADDLHPAANVAKMESGVPLDDDDRLPWLDTVGAALADAPGLVMACSALARRYRDRIRAAAPDVRFVELRVSREELDRRMRTRQHFMPAALLDSQLATLEHLEDDEPGVVVDNDGGIVEVAGRARVALDEAARAENRATPGDA